MSWLDLLKVQQDGVDVGSVSRIVLNLKSGPPVTSNDATGAYDIDFAAWLATINVTATTDGTVSLFGATPNTVLQSDGSTAGGVWRDYLALGTTPPTTGRVRLTDGDALVWDDGSAHDISCLSESGGYVTVGAVDANVVGVLLRAGAGGGAGAFVGIRTNNVNRLIIGDTGVDFPSAAPVTFTGNPTVDGGMGQWWVDKIDVGTAIGVGLGTLPAAGYIRLDNSGTIKWRSAAGGGAGADEFALEVASATLKLGPATTSGSTLALRGLNVTISAGAAGTITIPQAASVAFSGNPTVDGGTAQWSLDLLDVDGALTLDAAGYLSHGADPATTGALRLTLNDTICAKAPDGNNAKLLYMGESAGFAMGNFGDATHVDYLVFHSLHGAYFKTAGADSMSFTSTFFNLNMPYVSFAANVAAPIIYQATDSTAGGVRSTMLLHAQDSTVAGSTGADLHFRPGHGVTTHGELELQDATGTARLIIHDDSQVSILALVASDWQVGGVNVWASDGTHVETEHTHILFDESVATPIIAHSPNATENATVGDTTLSAGSVTAASGTAYSGDLGLKGGTASGSATNKHGNLWEHVAPASWNGLQRGKFVANCTTAPTGTPASGGYLYSDAGALYWRGSSGTVTCIAPA